MKSAAGYFFHRCFFHRCGLFFQSPFWLQSFVEVHGVMRYPVLRRKGGVMSSPSSFLPSCFSSFSPSGMNTRHALRHGLAALLCALFPFAAAQENINSGAASTAASGMASMPPAITASAKPAIPSSPTRPRIGLVLGGGGARGAAHLGILEVLERERVPVDCIAGTSMGALVAGSFAAGLSPQRMRENLDAANWRDMFDDNPEYSEMRYRNKRLSQRFLPGLEVGVSEDGVKGTPALVFGEKIKLFFNRMVMDDGGERVIETLGLPLAIVATDIGNGEKVVFRDGSLSKAMRASMSVPGLMMPVDYRKRKLVDGGLVDNVPIDEVRASCNPDIVIAVNVGSPLLKPEEVGSMLSVTAQMINILTEQNVTRSINSLKPTDIYIKPNLDGITAADFERYAETSERGKTAAEAVVDRLRKLSLPQEDYDAWRRKVERAKNAPVRVDAIEIAAMERVNPGAVEEHLTIKPGDTLDTPRLERDLLRAYGDGYYESVDYTLLSTRERNILRVTPVEKSWGPDYLRLGVNLQTDFSESSTYAIRGAYHKTWINPLGGELLLGGQIGNRAQVFAEFYQPLDREQRFFVEPLFSFSQVDNDLYQNDARFAQYQMRETRGALNLGANVGILGQARVGWLQRHISNDLKIGLPLFPSASVNVGGWHASFDFDQFNRLYFPTRGWSAVGSSFNSPNEDYSKAELDLRAAYTLGGWVANGRLYAVDSPSGKLPYYDAAKLGGMFELSAFAPGQIIGDGLRYGGLRIERIIGTMPLGIRGDLRVGLSLEGAKMRDRYTETERSGWLNSYALYVGGETPLGPAYFGYAYSSQGSSRWMLMIGWP